MANAPTTRVAFLGVRCVSAENRSPHGLFPASGQLVEAWACCVNCNGVYGRGIR